MKTTYQTHFHSAAEHGLAIVKSERGLATELFLGVKALRDQLGLDNIHGEFSKAMIDIEASFKDQLNGETLTNAVPAFKVRKSEINRALKEGADPAKFDNYRKFVDSVKPAKKVTDNKGKVTPSKSGAGNGTPDSNETTLGKVVPVVNSLPPKVTEKLNLVTKHLLKLDEAAMLEILTNCDTAICKKINKRGGALSNVGKATA